MGHIKEVTFDEFTDMLDSQAKDCPELATELDGIFMDACIDAIAEHYRGDAARALILTSGVFHHFLERHWNLDNESERFEAGMYIYTGWESLFENIVKSLTDSGKMCIKDLRIVRDGSTVDAVKAFRKYRKEYTEQTTPEKHGYMYDVSKGSSKSWCDIAEDELCELMNLVVDYYKGNKKVKKEEVRRIVDLIFKDKCKHRCSGNGCSKDCHTC